MHSRNGDFGSTHKSRKANHFFSSFHFFRNQRIKDLFFYATQKRAEELRQEVLSNDPEKGTHRILVPHCNITLHISKADSLKRSATCSLQMFQYAKHLVNVFWALFIHLSLKPCFGIFWWEWRGSPILMSFIKIEVERIWMYQLFTHCGLNLFGFWFIFWCFLMGNNWLQVGQPSEFGVAVMRSVSVHWFFFSLKPRISPLIYLWFATFFLLNFLSLPSRCLYWQLSVDFPSLYFAGNLKGMKWLVNRSNC